jgi:catechol 1,2-dioxygenase
MSNYLTDCNEVGKLVRKASGLDQPGGDTRLKEIVQQILSDLFRTIEKFEITPTEFWTAAGYLTRLGKSNETGLLIAGLGIERFLDMVLDAQERRAGLGNSTPRAIEGPLWIPDAPLEKGAARLDQDVDEGVALFMEGQVTDVDGKTIPGAIVDVWHANSKGGYSFFDPSQSPYNLRRRIETDAEGHYFFRSTLPVGYSCPPHGPTQALLNALGRHGHRPAHVHFFVHADGYRKLTTQINIAGDEYLHDDFAFATRDGLIPEAVLHDAPDELAARGVNAPFVTIHFDFALNRAMASLPDTCVEREHAQIQ